MKRWAAGLCLALICAACNPVLPCDPCTELADVRATLAVLVPTLTGVPPTSTASSTSTATVARTPTVAAATHTFTPTRTNTATPVLPTMTPTEPGTATQTAVWEYALSVSASPLSPSPGSLVTVVVQWIGPQAEIGLAAYPEQMCCASPADKFLVDGPTTIVFTVWMFSNATGAKTLAVYAKVGGEIVQISSVTVTVLGTTPTVTRTATSAGTPTPTLTPVVLYRLERRTWHFVENPGRHELLVLANATLPVGSPAGEICSYSPQFQLLDCEAAWGGWNDLSALETGRGDVWLWVDTIGAELWVSRARFATRSMGAFATAVIQ